ncbi:MAG: glycosyltransferase family 2 protein [Clostridia bacterium]|nr:glycosyltransferase family 2 protein [Clostridia bacterium]
MIKISKNSPYFSIIIPCYNCESYINTAIMSVLRQSFDSWEIIAVNDGSTDSTLNILQKYASEDKRIKLYSKENGGYCSAVNLGLNQVSGKYFTFMGSDDSLVNDMLAKIYGEINLCEPDMVGFRTVKYRDGQNIGIDSFTAFDTGVYENNTTIKEFQRKHRTHARILCVRDTSKFYKSELLGDLRYFGKYGFDADGIFAMLFTHKCISFSCVPVDGYNWTLRSNSLSGKKENLDIYTDRLNNWMKFYKILENVDRSLITDNEIDYVDYYYDAVWKYAEMLSLHDSHIKNLKKHTKYIFHIMRKYKITVGNSFKEKIINYLRLLFPVSEIKSKK